MSPNIPAALVQVSKILLTLHLHFTDCTYFLHVIGHALKPYPVSRTKQVWYSEHGR